MMWPSRNRCSARERNSFEAKESRRAFPMATDVAAISGSADVRGNQREGSILGYPLQPYLPGIITEVIADPLIPRSWPLPSAGLARARTRRSFSPDHRLLLCRSRTRHAYQHMKLRFRKERRDITVIQPAGILGRTNPTADGPHEAAAAHGWSLGIEIAFSRQGRPKAGKRRRVEPPVPALSQLLDAHAQRRHDRTLPLRWWLRHWWRPGHGGVTLGRPPMAQAVQKQVAPPQLP
jgi:hypothetical protein